GLDREHAVLDLVGILEQTTLGRPRGARAVAVVRPAVARTHEEAGLREPADRAAQVRAVDREHLELVARDAPHPGGSAGGLAVGGGYEGVAERDQPRLAFREL